jgi:hypothetical protein
VGSDDIRALLQRYVSNYIGTHMEEYGGHQAIEIEKLKKQNAKLATLLHRCLVKMHIEKADDDLVAE